MSTTCSASRRASYLVLRMHVVVASHQPLPAKGYGGPQRVVVALVRGLAALGHRVTLLSRLVHASPRRPWWLCLPASSPIQRRSPRTSPATPRSSTRTSRCPAHPAPSRSSRLS